eukprot:gene29536-38651_t
MSANFDSEFWLALHICDSSFPGGTLANSQGLESAVLHNAVKKNDTSSLMSYINLILDQNVSQTLPLIRTAHQISGPQVEQDVKFKLTQLDILANCILTNDIARRASVMQGKCFYKVIMESYPTKMNALHNALQLSSGAHHLPPLNFHFAPIFGCLCGRLGITLPILERMYMRMLLRDLISAATRLSVVGPLEGSRLQAHYAGFIEELLSSQAIQGVEQVEGADDDDNDDAIVILKQPVRFYGNVAPSQHAPVVDFLQSRQDTLYARLFNS